MKVTNYSKEVKPDFPPITLELTIETEEELLTLYHMTNMPALIIEKNSVASVMKTISYDKVSPSNGVLWRELYAICTDRNLSDRSDG